VRFDDPKHALTCKHWPRPSLSLVLLLLLACSCWVLVQTLAGYSSCCWTSFRHRYALQLMPAVLL
jgi:hypothetical protein